MACCSAPLRADVAAHCVRRCPRLCLAIGAEALERLQVVLAISDAQQAAVVQGIVSNNAYG